MPLIEDPRHSAADMMRWAKLNRYDRAFSQSAALRRKEAAALSAMRDFLEERGGTGYVGVSWGKDSTVLAHLAYQLEQETGWALPLVWIKVRPIFNPDCLAVRDVFLERYPMRHYREVTVDCWRDEDGWHARGTLESGADLAAARYGDAYISGIRGDESSSRTLRMMRWGVSSKRTCAPLGYWHGVDIFAYLERHDLPVHPAYGFSMNGVLDRDRLRVASLGGKRGDGMGRKEWERMYYRQHMHVIETQHMLPPREDNPHEMEAE